MTDVNIWVVLIGGLSAVVIGFVWYAPAVFGTVWMRLANVRAEDIEAGKQRMPLLALAGFAAAVVLSWVFAQFAVVWESFTLGSALELGFWIWLGFMVPILIGPFLWEQKSAKFVAINAAYWLVTTLVVATIVSLWG
ncbi:MAG: hypothetical protein CMI56_03480 [Parcubacteria group bacterium]|nr:hypothetical protein [Parcubacteria group bacterium]|tara:strand:- start:1460 stop:1870 length:411 start_codon:yes stop_codon:yes gene_type:complete